MTAELRAGRQLSVTIPAGAAESTVIALDGFGAGMVVLPASWTAARIGIKVSGAADGTFVPLKTLDNAYGEEVSAQANLSASSAYIIPWGAFAAPYIKLWSHNGSGTNVNQDAERKLIVFLKA